MCYSIINELRSNGIRPLKVVATKLGMPVTTAHSKINRLRDKFRGTLLLDFEKLGYSERIFFVVKLKNENDRGIAIKYLSEDDNINTLHITNHDSDFLFEAVFRNAFECRRFLEKMNSDLKLKKLDYYKIIKPVKIESFKIETDK